MNISAATTTTTTMAKKRSVKNPFKEEEAGCFHYVVLFAAALIVTFSFLASTDQGKSDARAFHEKHIAKHLHHLQQHHRNPIDLLDHHHPHHAEQQHPHRKLDKEMHGSTNSVGKAQQHIHPHQRGAAARHDPEALPHTKKHELVDHIHHHLTKKHHSTKEHPHEVHHEQQQHQQPEQHPVADHHDQQQNQYPVQQQHNAEHRHVNHHHRSRNSADGEDEIGFPELSVSEFPDWLHKYYKRLKWYHGENKKIKHLSHSILSKSLEQGCMNMVHNQRDEGNFNYQYDFVTEQLDTQDSQVRQAGALWGLALCFQQLQHHKDTPEIQRALEKGLDFFLRHAVPGPEKDSLMVRYPGESRSDTGANALVGLALIDYLRTIQDNHLDVSKERINELNEKFHGILEFLLYQQHENRHFASHYDIIQEQQDPSFSPYFDGESLLCLIKAAKYLDWQKDRLVPIIEETALILAKAYTLDAWREDKHDSDATKGFYQWSSMAFVEYYDAKWKDYDVFGDYVLSMAHWIIHTHRILHRTRNTGYAYEGLISAYQVAQLRNDEMAVRALDVSIDEGLHKISTWQVGGPLARENPFLNKHPTHDHRALGGVMNAQDQSPLRIDTTQHQMHAVIMALNSIYKNEW